MYDCKKIMKAAWRLFKAHTAAFADCLRRAWKAAKANAERIRKAANGLTVRTWYGWREIGRRVRHGQHAVFQIDLLKADGSNYRASFFTDEQLEV